MKPVKIDHDYTSMYFISDDLSSYGDMVEIMDNEWERYAKHEAETEYWQSKLHRIHEEDRRARMMEASAKAS